MQLIEQTEARGATLARGDELILVTVGGSRPTFEFGGPLTNSNKGWKGYPPEGSQEESSRSIQMCRVVFFFSFHRSFSRVVFSFFRGLIHALYRWRGSAALSGAHPKDLRVGESQRGLVK